MKIPSAEELAHSLYHSPSHSHLALDVLIAGGYTRRAAKRALAGEVATFAKDPTK